MECTRHPGDGLDEKRPGSGERILNGAIRRLRGRASPLLISAKPVFCARLP